MFIIYTHPGGTRELFPLHGFVERLSMLVGQAATSLFPRTHICVNGHAVIGSIAQLLFTYLGSRDGRRWGKKKNTKQKEELPLLHLSAERTRHFEMEAMVHQLLTKRITAVTWYRQGDISVAKRWSPMGQHQS